MAWVIYTEESKQPDFVGATVGVGWGLWWPGDQL